MKGGRLLDGLDLTREGRLFDKSMSRVGAFSEGRLCKGCLIEALL